MKIIIIVLFAVMIFFIFVFEYSRLYRFRKQSQHTWEARNILFKKLLNILPNFIACVQYYLPGKNELLSYISTTASRSMTLQFSKERILIEKELYAALEHLFSHLINTKDLMKLTNFKDIYDQLDDTMKNLKDSRNKYNNIVLLYNQNLSRFPGILIAKILKLKNLPIE